MVAINFTKFVDKVESGAKLQTIRSKRKRPIKQGDTLHLYTGMRTKQCRLIRVVPCLEDVDIEMFRTISGNFIYLNNRKLTTGRAEMLAIADGFASISAFWDWFFPNKKTIHFEGQLIKWKPSNFCLDNNSGIAL